MTNYVSAIPAYGRDYTTPEAVEADWAAGKDFQIQDLRYGAPYMNKDDKPANWQLNIRFNKKRDICVIPADSVPVATDYYGEEELQLMHDTDQYLD